MSWYLQVLQKYAVFSGRARRKEYWTFTLINFVIVIVLSLVVDTLDRMEGFQLLLSRIMLVYSLGMVLPWLAVLVRRLHDTNHTEWWLFLLFVPVIGSLILLMWLVTDSDPGLNWYGSNPKEEIEARLT